MSRSRLGIFLMCLAMAAPVRYLAQAEPLVPESDDVVLGAAIVRADATTSRDRAAALIRQARADQDPRLYSRAETLIAMKIASRATPELLTLRAIIRQARHDFDGALDDLAKVITYRPGDPQARLTRAFIFMTRGAYPQALSDCQAAPKAAGPLVRAVCFARLMSLTGKAGEGYSLLTDALRRMPGAEAALKSWAHTLLAEIAVRTGLDEQASRHFQRALSLSDNAPSVRLSYAIFLLERGETAQSLNLIEEGDQSDAAMLLRLRATARQGGDTNAAAKLLRARFNAARREGLALHLREEARFLLDIALEPAAALIAAEANWAVQREPEDMLVLIEAAQAAGEPDRAAPALMHIRAFGLQDVRIEAVLARTGAK